MVQKSGQETTATSDQEGKSYEYQQPQGTEHGGSASPSLATARQQLVSAFEQFIDAVATTHTGGGDSGKGSRSSVGTVGGQGGSYANTGSAGGQGSAGTVSAGTSTGGTGPTGTTGTGSQGTTGRTGSTGSSGSMGSAGMGSASSATTSSGGHESAGSTEAFAKSTAGLRESYRLDVAREALRKQRPPEAARPSASGHTRDSNRAPVRAVREFAPGRGRAGRSSAPTKEVMAVRPPDSARPETAPAPVQAQVRLDAYWASYKTPLERAEERARIARNAPLLEVILGTDERVRVTNTQDYPYRCICSLLITAQNGSEWVGTGWLVGPRLVLTAGHCVYMADEGGWAARIEVIPGRDGTEQPFKSVVATDLRSVTGWTVDGNRDFDYGAILLPETQRYGDQLGWFGYAAREDDYLRGIDLNLAGYPGDGGKDHVDGTMWWDHRRVKEVNEKQITYEIDTYGGQSGSPVWEMDATGDRMGVAIHTWGTSTSNGGTRITSEVFDNIIAWAGEVP